MEELSVKDYTDLDEWLATADPSLRPIIRWLALGPVLSRSLFAADTREPIFEELARLVRLAQLGAPTLLTTVETLILRSEHSEVLQAEVQLDRLIAEPRGAWSHPVQVLEAPRAAYGALLGACELRLVEASEGDDRSDPEHLESVRNKLARAVRIASTAHRRRQQRSLQQQREARRQQRRNLSGGE